MQIEIWSDVVCPWCYIGKRHLEEALRNFGGDDVVLIWRSFQLDPSAPKISQGDPTDRLAKKYGRDRAWAEAAQQRVTAVAKEAGLDYHLEISKPGNTFDAHRLLHLAKTRGLQGALKEHLMAAYFTEGASIGDEKVLHDLAVASGLDSDDVWRVLRSDDFAADVREDIEQAAKYGITGVPFFVVDAKYGISGAQPSEIIEQVLRKALEDLQPA